jgi:hypothetical protein
MNSRRIIPLLLLTTCIIFLLILRIISYKNSNIQMERNFKIASSNETIAIENFQLLIEWTRVQNILWLSYFKDFGSILLSDTSCYAPNQNIPKNKLVYWFSNRKACHSCIDPIMDLLKSIADSIGYNSILVISDFKDEREMNIFESKYQLLNVCARFEPGRMAAMLENASYQNHLFFILNENDQILFPAFVDQRIGFSEYILQGALNYLAVK